MKIYDFQFHSYTPEVIESFRDEKRCKDKVYPFINENDEIFYNKIHMASMDTPSFYDKLLFYDLCDYGEKRIKNMDKFGITMGVFSPSPGYEQLDKEESIKQCKIYNDTVAEAVNKYPDRFRGAIALPILYVDEAIEELERAVNELGLEYLHVHSSYGKENIADDKFIPLLEKCEELDVPIYLHPAYLTEPYLVDCGVMFSSAGFGFGVDVMRTSMLFILNGRFDQFPKLKLIIGHMGEFYPFILERMDNRFFSVPLKLPEVNCEHTFTYYFENKNIFIDTGGITDPKVMMFAIDKLGIDSVIFGSDYPYEPYEPIIEAINQLPISDEDKEKIFYKNAEKYILRNK